MAEETQDEHGRLLVRHRAYRGDRSCRIVAEIDDGGSAKIVTGVTEIGEGILTVLAQIAAHEMGVKPEHVVIGDNDTARSPEASHAGASARPT